MRTCKSSVTETKLQTAVHPPTLPRHSVSCCIRFHFEFLFGANLITAGLPVVSQSLVPTSQSPTFYMFCREWPHQGLGKYALHTVTDQLFCAHGHLPDAY